MRNQCTKFEVSTFSRSRYILGKLKSLSGSRDVVTLLSGTIGRQYIDLYSPLRQKTHIQHTTITQMIKMMINDK